jgi:methyl-accepting chemotaxis protein
MEKQLSKLSLSVRVLAESVSEANENIEKMSNALEELAETIDNISFPEIDERATEALSNIASTLSRIEYRGIRRI